MNQIVFRREILNRVWHVVKLLVDHHSLQLIVLWQYLLQYDESSIDSNIIRRLQIDTHTYLKSGTWSCPLATSFRVPNALWNCTIVVCQIPNLRYVHWQDCQSTTKLFVLKSTMSLKDPQYLHKGKRGNYETDIWLYMDEEDDEKYEEDNHWCSFTQGSAMICLFVTEPQNCKSNVLVMKLN
jgi:hypothetical protein